MSDSKFSSFKPTCSSKDQKKHRRTDSTSGGELRVGPGQQEWSGRTGERRPTSLARTASDELGSLGEPLSADATSKAIRA